MKGFTQPHFLIGFLFLVALASGGDILADLSHGSDVGHLMQEGVILVVTLIILGFLIVEHRSNKQQLASLKIELEEARNLPEPGLSNVHNARRRLSQAIDEQFSEWQLTTSERDVGLLLLKGCTLKEIALLRGTAEKTIRQQASAIYQKSGIPGRHAFSAWFIEDLL